MKYFSFLPAVGFLLAALISANAGLLGEVSRGQQTELGQGKTVLVSEDLPDKAWPRLKLYRVVNAPRDVVESLLMDFKSAPSYTPGMLGAEMVANPSKNVKDIQYTVKVPVLSKITYTVRNYYEQTPEQFCVRWELLQSPIASESTGSLRVEPYGAQSLLSYTNHVTPSVPMAGMLKSQASKEAVTTIEAIAAEAERRASSKSAGS